MKIKQTILSLGLIIGICGLFLGPNVSAAICGKDANGNDLQTSILDCKPPADCTGVECTGIWGILLIVLNILTAGVGIVAIGGIVYGSILYTAAGGNPDQVKKARTIIRDTIIGLVAFAFLFSLLNYLIPGGLFKP